MINLNDFSSNPFFASVMQDTENIKYLNNTVHLENIFLTAVARFPLLKKEKYNLLHIKRNFKTRKNIK